MATPKSKPSYGGGALRRHPLHIGRPTEGWQPTLVLIRCYWNEHQPPCSRTFGILIPSWPDGWMDGGSKAEISEGSGGFMGRSFSRGWRNRKKLKATHDWSQAWSNNHVGCFELQKWANVLTLMSNFATLICMKFWYTKFAYSCLQKNCVSPWSSVNISRFTILSMWTFFNTKAV